MAIFWSAAVAAALSRASFQPAEASFAHFFSAPVLVKIPFVYHRARSSSKSKRRQAAALQIDFHATGSESTTETLTSLWFFTNLIEVVD
jgi:hypothetical protein